MRLLQFKKDGKICLGVETEKGVVDVSAEAARCGVSVPGSMLELAGAGKEALNVISKLADEAVAYLSDVEYAPVISGMEKIMCIGLNYVEHAEECSAAVPEYPVLFAKYGNAIAAHGDEIFLPREFFKYDYEAEIVVVIGKEAKNVSREDAKDYIFGYTTGNDLSNRQLQMERGGQWVSGKIADGFAPIGPVLVTEDSLDTSDILVQSYVNGELRQSARTSIMLFPCDYLVSYLSSLMTLKPGDIIFTGTPPGVMLGYPDEKKSWLKPGDVVDIKIEGIGTLTNKLK